MNLKLSRTALRELTRLYRGVLMAAMISVAFVASAAPARADDGYNLVDGDAVVLETDKNITNTVDTEGAGRKTAILAAGTSSITTGDNTLTINAGGASARNYIFNTETAGTDFTFTGNLDASLVSTGSVQGRGIRVNSSSNVTFDGSIKVDVTTASAEAYGSDIWPNNTVGSKVEFKGSLTDIKAKSTGNQAFGVYANRYNGGTSQYIFNADDTKISAEGSSVSGTATAAWIAYSDATFNGDTQIVAKNAAGTGSGIRMLSDTNQPKSTAHLNGDNISVSVTDSLTGWGVIASGNSEVSSTSRNLNITVDVADDAFGLWSQYGANIDLKEGSNTTVNATAENGAAYGVFERTYAGLPGSLTSHGNLTANATGNSQGIAVFVTEGSSFNADQLTATGTATGNGGYGMGALVDDSTAIIGSAGKTSYLKGVATGENGIAFGLMVQQSATGESTATLKGNVTVEGSSRGIYNNGGTLTNDATLTIKNGIYNTGTILSGGNASYVFNAATSDNGGAIYNSGTITLSDGIQFIGNGAGAGGAIFNAAGGTVTVGDNALFKDNTAEYASGSNPYGGSDIKNYGTVVVGDNATFTRSTYQDAINDDDVYDTGIYTMNGSSTTIGKNATFKNIAQVLNNEANTTHVIGDGATFEHNGSVITNFGGTYTIGNNATFKESQFATLVNKTTSGGSITVGDNALFENNQSPVFHLPGGDWTYMSGNGAVANNNSTNSTMTFGNGFVAKGNLSAGKGIVYNVASSTVNFNGSADFTNNTAEEGVIHNAGTVNLNGDVSFSGNKNNAGAAVADIYNTGALNIGGNLTLNGGIANTGTIAFASGSSLTALLDGFTVVSGETGTITGETNLVLGNGADGSTFVMEGDKSAFAFAENSLYTINLEGDAKTYTIAKKSTDEIVENLVNEGVATQEAAVISAIADSSSDSPVLNAISEAVQTGNATGAAKAAKDLAPTTSQQVMGVAQSISNLLSNVARGRMAALGRSGGDAFVGGSAWVQGLYNYAKQDASGKNAGFSANSTGVVLGIDGKVNDALTLGIGYGYTYTDASSDGRNTDIDGHNFFVYGQYQPCQFYVNTMLSYGFSKYTEKKSPMGIMMKAKYDVDTFAVNVMTGYDFKSGITPEGGLRYVRADQESYNDGVQRISTDTSDVLTAVAGVKYTTDVKAKGWTFKPTLRLAATYDVKSDNSKANVNIVGGGGYQITGDRLHRFGVETGVGVGSTIKDWDLTLEYNGGFRKDFQSHTGMLKAKYHF